VIVCVAQEMDVEGVAEAVAAVAEPIADPASADPVSALPIIKKGEEIRFHIYNFKKKVM
jgi:hypothetical protein